MKQIILLIFAVACLSSCTTINRALSKNKTHLDSTSKTASNIVGVQKKDSSGNTNVITTRKITSDSGYTRTTTIKEYFSDEFGDSGAPDTVRNKVKDSTVTIYVTRSPGKLKYRETEIKETGAKQATEESAMLNNSTSKINTSDSTSDKQRANTEVNKTVNTTTKNVAVKREGASWWIIVCVLLVIGAALYELKGFKL